MLTIKSNIKLSEIQKEFNTAFPFLKLELTLDKNGSQNATSKKDQILSDLAVQPVDKYKNGLIQVSENMSVTKLEEMFQDQFGISVQVFRKSGKWWLGTTITDDWTLKRQNDQGKELSIFQ